MPHTADAHEVERALQIVEDALEHDVTTRARYVDQRCAHEPGLRREVHAILGHTGGLALGAARSPVPPPEIPSRYHGDDRYELCEEVARGSMGQIVRAIDRDLGREIALKILVEPWRDDPEAVRLFLREARIEAWLQHPGVPAVHEVGRLADGRPFLAMKLVRGRTLRSHLTDGADRSMLLSVFQQLCQTMAFAHAHGIIHRDLKPDNVMIGAFGEVQLMDWGLAIVDDASAPIDRPGPIVLGRAAVGGPDLAEWGRFQTRVGRVMGTPAYMPPEQFEGWRSKQMDVFALGAMLCEILTGAPPYGAGTSGEVLAKSARADLEDAMLRLAGCGADDQLVRLACRCLEIDPERRLADADAVANAIQTYHRSVESRAREAELEKTRALEALRKERQLHWQKFWNHADSSRAD